MTERQLLDATASQARETAQHTARSELARPVARHRQTALFYLLSTDFMLSTIRKLRATLIPGKAVTRRYRFGPVANLSRWRVGASDIACDWAADYFGAAAIVFVSTSCRIVAAAVAGPRKARVRNPHRE
jgi:hypothetical protein